MGVFLFSLLATMVATSQGLLYSSCLSWRLGVETNNIRDWITVPLECGIYIIDYMSGPHQQYRKDSHDVATEAIHYAGSLNVDGHSEDIWVFDIDETSLSNLPFYAQHGYGTRPPNLTAAIEWVTEAKAPALPETLKLYRYLLSRGIKVAFLTGRSESLRNATTKNLIDVGYHTWEKLILKAPSYSGKTTIQYKSNERKKLEKSGYRIVGNIGDQWSDLLGVHPGNRTFKLPNPLYSIA